MQVDELELNADMKSVDNLLSFLEKVFNGGSDFKCVLQSLMQLPHTFLPPLPCYHAVKSAQQ